MTICLKVNKITN